MLTVQFRRRGNAGAPDLEQGPYLCVGLDGDTLWVVPAPTRGEVREAREQGSAAAGMLAGLAGPDVNFAPMPSREQVALATRRPADGLWVVNGFDGAAFPVLMIVDDHLLEDSLGAMFG